VGTESGGDDKNLRSPNRFRPFLLSYPCGREDNDQPYPNEHLNPLAALENLRNAWTVPPMRGFWFPGELGLSFNEMAALFAHESLHGYLSDHTVLGYYNTILTHFQYAAIMRAFETNTPIYIPSLREPTGILARAQLALDQINKPMALVHELMATSFVRFVAEKGGAVMRPHLSHLLIASKTGRLLSIVFDMVREIDAKDYDPTRVPVWMTYAEFGPGYTEVIKKAEKSWLDHFPKLFPEYDFLKFYERLLDVWYQIGGGEQEDFLTLHLRLCRYPFQIPPTPEMIPSLAVHAWFERICSYAVQMKEEPVRRLELLLSTIEYAKNRNLHGSQEWEAYLKASLPEFAASLDYAPSRWLPKIEEIWKDFESNPQRGSVLALSQIALTQLFPTEATIILGSLPVANFDVVYTFKAFEGSWPPELIKALKDVDWKAVLMLEAIRQALLRCRGVTCLCKPELREFCVLRRWLELLWNLATPDPESPEYQEWFEQHWQKPACMEVAIYWKDKPLELLGIPSLIADQIARRTRGVGDATEKILWLVHLARLSQANKNVVAQVQLYNQALAKHP
jgi:hypothetical protein